jgi:hypothetical protein
VLGDYDGDGKMEIFITIGWAVVIVDGNGRILTNTRAAVDKTTPFYVTKGLIQNNPALGDVDGDGVLELIVQNSELTIWDLPAGARTATWPMFRQNALRTGAVAKKDLVVDPLEVSLLNSAGDGQQVALSLAIDVSGSPFQWQGRVISANGVRLPQSSGSGFGRAEVPLEIEWPATLGPGEYLLGLVEITVQSEGLKQGTQTRTVPVRLKLIHKASEQYIPSVIGSP